MRAPAARLGACAVLLLGVVPSALASAGAGPSQAQRSLDRTLTADVNAAGGRDSALVVDTNTGQVLFSLNPLVGRLPASVEKLYTTTTALLEFGPDATFQTSVLGAGRLAPHGVWHGTLYLRGGGDPTFGSQSFDNLNYGKGIGATVQELAAQVRAAGIRSLDGSIVGDESYFDSVRGTPATGGAPNIEVEGELSGLSFDDGFLTPAENSLQPHPAIYAAQQFAAALRADRVKVPQTTRIGAGVTPAYNQTVASVASPPLSTLMQLTNAPSDNFFAETLLKDIGAQNGTVGTTAAGAAVVRLVIRSQLNLRPRLDDGSGLSRYDRTTASSVVSLLEQMQQNPAFTDSLAVAGVSGTMEGEMLGTRAVDNCRGKTGTLHDVANLVGYCTARNGDTLAFAFLFNSQANSTYGHLMEDRMGVALANYNGPGQGTTQEP
jgi:serine-type D-Ala-D-Ala carboxypeptidase/endopeptidase (penicillin-binding protein 4)